MLGLKCGLCFVPSYDSMVVTMLDNYKVKLWAKRLGELYSSQL